MVSSAYFFFFHTIHTRLLKRLARTSAYIKRSLNDQHMFLLFQGWGEGGGGGGGAQRRGDVFYTTWHSAKKFGLFFASEGQEECESKSRRI